MPQKGTLLWRFLENAIYQWVMLFHTRNAGTCWCWKARTFFNITLVCSLSEHKLTRNTIKICRNKMFAGVSKIHLKTKNLQGSRHSHLRPRPRQHAAHTRGQFAFRSFTFRFRVNAQFRVGHKIHVVCPHLFPMYCREGILFMSDAQTLSTLGLAICSASLPVPKRFVGMHRVPLVFCEPRP